MASSLFYATTIHFSIGLWLVTKKKKRKGFYMTTNKDQIFSGMDGEEAPKYFPNSTLNQKKKKQKQKPGLSWLLFGGLLLVWSIATFWIQAKLNWWDSPKTATAAGICQQNGPNSSPWKCPTTCCTKCFKSWMNWITKFCLIHHIHLTSCQLTTTSSSISIASCREDVSTTSKRQKMFSKSL